MYVGIDIGTGSLKAVLGLKSDTHTITEQYMKKMFREGHHSAEFFKESVLSFLKRISEFSRKCGEKIEGICLCGHGPSILLIDSKGNPQTDIVTWQDSNAVCSAKKLKKIIDRFAKDGTSYEAKLLKLFTENNDLFANGTKAMYPKDYVIFLLTGRSVIDFSTAATLAFFNTESLLFDTYSTGIPTDVFPEVINSWEEAGRTGTDYSRKSGLFDDIPVIAGGIDSWCEAIGAGAIEDGLMVDGSGTSTCITCCRTEGDSKLYHVIPERSLDIETMSSTGASISWLMDLMNIDLSEIKKTRSFVPVPLLYHPYLDGERSPVWDEKVSASFTGLNSGSSREDLIKSVLQGIAFGTKQCVKLAGKGSECSGSGIRAVGGGANNKTLLQYKADITGIRFIVLKETDAAPLGAMILASFACGEGSITELTEKWVKINYEVVPDNTYREIWDKMFTIYSDHYYRVKESNHSLFELRNELGKYT
jgi:xylulokinase